MSFLTRLTYLLLFLLFYAYIGYPLLLLLLAKLFSNPTQKAPITPTVTLIVAAFNEADIIKQKIENSLNLDYPTDKLDILIITDGSNDSTPDVVASYADQGIRLMHNPERRGKSAAINRAAAQATSDILVFSDANAFYLEDTIHTLVRNFADDSVGAVSGRKTVRASDSVIAESEGLYWKYESLIKKKASQLRSTTGVVGEMIAIRRDLYEPIDPTYINDDAYLAVSLMGRGYRVLYEPEAVCWETSAVSTHDEVIRRKRITSGRFQLLFSPNLWMWNDPIMLFLYGSHKFLRLLLAFIMIGAFITNGLRLLWPNAGLLLTVMFVGQVIFYVAAGIGRYLESQGKKSKLPAIAYYITSGNLASIPGLLSYLQGKQTVLWEKAKRGALVPE